MVMWQSSIDMTSYILARCHTSQQWRSSFRLSVQYSVGIDLLSCSRMISIYRSDVFITPEVFLWCPFELAWSLYFCVPVLNTNSPKYMFRTGYSHTVFNIQFHNIYTCNIKMSCPDFEPGTRLVKCFEPRILMQATEVRRWKLSDCVGIYESVNHDVIMFCFMSPCIDTDSTLIFSLFMKIGTYDWLLSQPVGPITQGGGKLLICVSFATSN